MEVYKRTCRLRQRSRGGANSDNSPIADPTVATGPSKFKTGRSASGDSRSTGPELHITTGVHRLQVSVLCCCKTPQKQLQHAGDYIHVLILETLRTLRSCNAEYQALTSSSMTIVNQCSLVRRDAMPVDCPDNV